MPEGVEIEAVPEFEGEPAAAPLARAGKLDVGEAELERGVCEPGIWRAVFGEEVDLTLKRKMGVFVGHL